MKIISTNYLIYQSKIFYLYQDIPPPHGILDMEKLNLGNKSENENDKQIFQIGPMPVDGNNEFLIVYKNKNTFEITTKFY